MWGSRVTQKMDNVKPPRQRLGLSECLGIQGRWVLGWGRELKSTTKTTPRGGEICKGIKNFTFFVTTVLMMFFVWHSSWFFVHDLDENLQRILGKCGRMRTPAIKKSLPKMDSSFPASFQFQNIFFRYIWELSLFWNPSLSHQGWDENSFSLSFLICPP